jgi:hypothetical protein
MTHTPRPRATALPFLLLGLIAGSASPTLAAPAAKPRAPAAPPQADAGDLPVVEGGRATGQKTAEAARHDGLTVLDLSDEWLPSIFSETPDKPEPLRPFLIDLANEKFRSGSKYSRAREDRYFEAFGIPPSLNLLRRRIAERRRHACHARVKDGALEQLSEKNVIPAEEAEKVPNPALAPGEKPTEDKPSMIYTGKTVSPRPLTELEHRAVVAMQAHLRCEDLLSGKAIAGRMDRRTEDGLRKYQRLQMVGDSGNIDLDTRTALLGDSREQDFLALLRALRERVVDATGLIEDGSASGVVGEVQGRELDTAEFRPLPKQPAGASAAAPASTAALAPVAPSAVPAPTEAKAADSKPALKITPAPDLIAAATQAASDALGWSSPDAVLASTIVAPRTRKAPRKGLLPLPVSVAVRLPPLPAYHGSTMELRAEVDRGEVVLARPKLDKDGRKMWKPPVADRPTLTLFAKVGDGEIALVRWPTTIGGWKTIQRSDGSLALKYKESVTGEALWPEVLVGPTWHPGGGAQTRHLLVKNGDRFEAKTDLIGPGYRAAYGLVAIVHHQIEGMGENGQPQLVDHRIRTHGTPVYRSVRRGESSGCHRLHNYEALRLSGFLVRHHGNTRDGLVPEDYERKLEYKGQQISLLSSAKGYRFAFTPPIHVTVLDGDVKGNAKSVRSIVPLAITP